jgi:hypothetical protein
LDTYDGATCARCSAWFRLERDNEPGVVTLDQRGVITRLFRPADPQ